MKSFLVLLKYGFYNQLRSRWLIAYCLFYFCITYALMQFGNDPTKGILSLISVVILFNPAITLLYATVYWYAMGAFNHLLLMQPVSRKQAFLSHWMSVALGLSASFTLGSGIGFVSTIGLTSEFFHFIFVGIILHFCFSSLGLFCGIFFSDRMRGISAALGLWLYFAIIHDGLVFLLLISFRDYPMEKLAYVLMSLNPIDLSRLYLLFQFDLAALMGYTGSILQRMANSGAGTGLLVIGLISWVLCPTLLSIRKFDQCDL